MSSTPKHSAHASPVEKRALLAQLLRTGSGKARSLYPLSHGQRALWFMHQLAPESSAYTVSFAARIDSDLDIPALQRAFQGLVNRHPVLRTTFTTRDGEPAQQVHEDMRVFFEEIDASSWSEDDLNNSLFQKAHQPFDLEQGPVMRTYLYTRRERKRILLLAAHHIAVDGVSIVVFLDELSVLYAAEKAGIPASLPPLALQYTDYVRWQSSVLGGPEGERLWEYWRKQLEGDLPVLNLTKDRVRPPVQTFHGAVYSFTVGEELTQQLKVLARTQGLTLYMTLLMAFKTLLHRYSGQEDILVGSPMVCRGRAEFERIVGYFINPVVLRTSLSGNPTLKSFLGQVRQTVLGALAHRDYPFPLLVERLQLDRNPGISPFFQIMFNMPKVNRFEEQEALLFVPGQAGIRLNLGELRLDIFAVEQRAAMFDLTLSVVEVGRALSASFQYNTDLFDAATIARMKGHYQNVLESIVRDPEQKVADVPLLTSSERRQLLIEWNSTRADLPRDQCFHQLFEAQVERTPDKVAAVFKDENLSYQQLNRRANRLARELVKQEIGPSRIVAVLSERNLDLLTAMIAVFKAGGSYLPLDPGYPAKRLMYVLDRSKATLVLTTSTLIPTLTQALASTSSEGFPLVLQIEELLWQEQDEQNLPARCTPGDLAYVIYTSGSTGEPKGAMIEHRGMLNHLYAKVTDLHLVSTDSIAQTASQCFDISVWQFLAALLVGGRVHIFNDEITHDPAQLLEQTRCQGISILEVVPSLLREMLDEIRRDGVSELSLRWLILTGETLSPDLCRQWLHYYPIVPLLNAYGPTECSDDVTHYLLDRPPAADVTRIPIGRPIANTRLYVLDSQMHPVPIGVTGELYIGGIDVGRGYLNDAKRTDEVFVPDPFVQKAGARLYKTGDLAYYRPDGNLLFLGRTDHQVKIRGFRIELDEIEAVLGQHPVVQETVVMAREDAPGERLLVAYVVAKQPAAPPISELRSFLQEKVPDYMVPSVFVFLDSLPLTPNGKVDRRALPMPDTSEPPLEETFVAPRTDDEEVLANIWGEVLGLERVSIHGNFFELGGHSVLAARLIFRVREALQIALPLHSLFQNPTVAGLAEAISNARRASQSLVVPTVTDLNSEANLDFAVCPETVSAKPLVRPTSIFLTGATGFLGVFLLYELLRQTSADIYCLVRSPNLVEGKRRIQENLEAYSLWDKNLSARIIGVPGDLSQPLLGMSAQQFQLMANKVDTIYHSGALVDFTFPYSKLKAANVAGTEEVLRLACQVKVKPVHFVSTISVFQSAGTSGIREVREHDELDLGEDLYDGYSQSKWVAEKLVTIARSRGLPVAIYRPGTVTGHSQTGVCETKDFICRVIKGCVQLGSVPDLDFLVDMTPVDYASKALVYLSMREESYGKAFHLNNPQPLHWDKLVNNIRSLGYPLQQVSTDKWVLHLLSLDKQLFQNVLYPLLPHLSSAGIQRRLSQAGTLRFDHRNTIAGLTGSSISCPPVDTDLLSTYFAYFVGSGYLDPGEKSVSSSWKGMSSEQ